MGMNSHPNGALSLAITALSISFMTTNLLPSFRFRSPMFQTSIQPPINPVRFSLHRYVTAQSALLLFDGLCQVLGSGGENAASNEADELSWCCGFRFFGAW